MHCRDTPIRFRAPRRCILKLSMLTVSSEKDHELPSVQAISPAEALALSRFVHDLKERARQVTALLTERKLPTLKIIARSASDDLEALEREFLSLAHIFAPAVRNEAVCPSATNVMAILTQNSSDE
jgi:hypothetical protein